MIRPVPLQQTFIGLTETNAMKRLQVMNETAFDMAIQAVKKGKQVGDRECVRTI